MKYQEDLTLHMLICSRDYEMAIKSIQSFLFHCKEKYYIFFHDDGSLKNSEIKNLEKVIPDSKVITKKQSDHELKFLKKEYPLCHKYRENCLWALKLVDLLFYGGSEFLYVDSDLVFLRPFQDLFSLSDTQSGMIYMMDSIYSYRFNFIDIIKGLPKKIVWRLNAGFIYAKNLETNFDVLEQILRRWPQLLERGGCDQTIWSIIAAKENSFYWNPRAVRMVTWKDKSYLNDGVVLHLSSPVRSKFSEAIKYSKRKIGKKTFKVNKYKSINYKNYELFLDILKKRIKGRIYLFKEFFLKMLIKN